MSEIDVSVVIPCYNEAETIGEQLEALARESWERRWEVVVADNGSTDASVAVAERYRGRVPGLRVVDASARRGGSYALNVGARAARGRALAFCDADDVIAPGWVAAIGEALDRHTVVASRHGGERLNADDVVRSRGHNQTDGLQVLWYPPYLPHAGGCGLAMRRSVFEAAGGFDESLLRLKDTDLCIRLQRMGETIRFVPEATIYIRHRDTIWSSFRQRWLSAVYNTRLYHRYAPPGAQLPGAWRAYLRRWRRVLRLARRARSRARRIRLARQLGWQIGLLEGSLRYRTPPIAPSRAGRERARERARARTERESGPRTRAPSELAIEGTEGEG